MKPTDLHQLLTQITDFPIDEVRISTKGVQVWHSIRKEWLYLTKDGDWSNEIQEL